MLVYNNKLYFLAIFIIDNFKFVLIITIAIVSS